jgi:hypothetical protein
MNLMMSKKEKGKGSKTDREKKSHRYSFCVDDFIVALNIKEYDNLVEV